MILLIVFTRTCDFGEGGIKPNLCFLKLDGKLILGVPKLELYPDLIEEVFIDPHTFPLHIDILEYAKAVDLTSNTYQMQRIMM